MQNVLGYIFFVGAGPGDPGLLTIKGQKALAQAEVVIYDRLLGEKLLSYAPDEAELIYVGKSSGCHALPQDEINTLLVKKASEGKKVVRLKGGDPFLFGRGGEEAQFVRKYGIDFEIIPGVTSAIAVPAYAGIPVTHRDVASSVAVITGHEKPGKSSESVRWAELAGGPDTLVFLMGMENLEYICQQLVKNGKDPATPLALIRWGTLPEQEVLTGTLQTIIDQVRLAGFKPPAVVVIGSVVDLRNELNWVEQKPLWGKKVIVTRSRSQASQLSEAIYDLGGEAIEFPTISISRETNMSPLYNALRTIDKYEWVIFTSVNAVEIFFDELIRENMDIRTLHGLKIAAVGSTTAEVLNRRGLRVDIIPDEYLAEGIIDKLKERVQAGEWVLLPRARGARNVLPEALRQMKVSVNEVFLYEAKAEIKVSRDTLRRIIEGEADYLTFTSSSTVRNFVKIVGEENVNRINKNLKVACIGPITAATAAEYGFRPSIIAQVYTIAGLVQAILADTQA